MSETNAQRNYKDTVFRMLFREKKNLLSLYNALNETAYTDVNGLEITTLENAVYMNYKNDISFVFDFELLLYEHQSTLTPNMPLRDLIYVTRVIQNGIKDENLYSATIVRIPTPKFVVFYNGTGFQSEQQILKLSDAFEKKQDEPELTVLVYNINPEHNRELLEACRMLKEYAQYVETVRIFAREEPFSASVEHAVDHCIRNGILSEFLSRNRAEAIAVSIFEYNEEKHMKSEREEWREIGREDLAQILKSLMDAGKTEDLKRALSDKEYRKQLCRKYNQV